MNRKELLIGLFVGALTVYLLSSFVVEKRLESVRSTLQDNIKSQTELATEIAKFIATGAQYPEVAELISECPVDSMVSYDSLLSSLDKGLGYQDLVKLNSLFAACGGVVAERRAITAIQLAEKVEGLSLLTQARIEAGSYQTEENMVSKWQELSKKETQISYLFLRLVDAQESIIVALINNVPPTSITVENIRASAQTLKEEMISLTTEVTKLRTELLVTS